MKQVIIEQEKCTGCGICMGVCPDKAILAIDGAVRHNGLDCLLCGHCRAVCPADAVRLPEQPERLGLTTIAEQTEVVPPGKADCSELVALMRSRRSCRRYKEQAVPLEVLTDLVKIGTTAPSGTNSQGWNFVILPTRDDLLVLGGLVSGFYRKLNRLAANPLLRLLVKFLDGDSLGRYYRNYYESVTEALREWDEEGTDRLFHGATAAILVTGRRDAGCPAEDALLATQNMLLAAHTMGLGSCLIGFAVEAMRRNPAMKRKMAIPEAEEIYNVIALGFPAVSYIRQTGRREVAPRILRPAANGNGTGIMEKNVDTVPLRVVLFSFGFKYGPPVDVNFLWDVRLLPNPHWVAELQPGTGLEPPVADYALENATGREFWAHLAPLLDFLVDQSLAAEKKVLRIAVGCTGGRHRSVAVAEKIAAHLAESCGGKPVKLTVFHRDIDRDNRKN